MSKHLLWSTVGLGAFQQVLLFWGKQTICNTHRRECKPLSIPQLQTAYIDKQPLSKSLSLGCQFITKWISVHLGLLLSALVALGSSFYVPTLVTPFLNTHTQPLSPWGRINYVYWSADNRGRCSHASAKREQESDETLFVALSFGWERIEGHIMYWSKMLLNQRFDVWWWFTSPSCQAWLRTCRKLHREL